MHKQNPNDESCGNCKFWLQHDVTVPLGLCRRNPPAALFIATSDGPQPVSASPPTKKNSWCGEHQRGNYIEAVRTLNGVTV